MSDKKKNQNKTMLPLLPNFFLKIFYFLSPATFLCRAAVSREGQKVLRIDMCVGKKLNFKIKKQLYSLLQKLGSCDDFGHLLA